MPRFVRGQPDDGADGHGPVSHSEHPELVQLVNAYCEPLAPSSRNPLSVREQYLKGICRPRRVQDVAWGRFDRRSNGRYPT
jgi:hypothetical protein